MPQTLGTKEYYGAPPWKVLFYNRVLITKGRKSMKMIKVKFFNYYY